MKTIPLSKRNQRKADSFVARGFPGVFERVNENQQKEVTHGYYAGWKGKGECVPKKGIEKLEEECRKAEQRWIQGQLKTIDQNWKSTKRHMKKERRVRQPLTRLGRLKQSNKELKAAIIRADERLKLHK